MTERVDRQLTSIKKVDEELQIVWGEVYVPELPDSQGDFMTTLEVRKMAYSFMYAGRLGKVDMNHDNTINGSMIVESFIARSDDAVFIPGSWVVGMHIPDKEIWGMIKSGK